MRRLPPLNAVKAFEAAARLGSFTRAGAELQVTHGAVSRQVALLEGWLGAPLFQRNRSQLTLTPAGHRFAQALGGALDRIEAAAAEAGGAADESVLSVNAPPTFALRWLIPRLATFRRRHRGVDVRLTTSLAPIDMADSPYDIVIRGSEAPPPNCAAQRFLPQTVVAVCHPDLREAGPLERPADLSHHVLLSYATAIIDWDDWIAAVGEKPVQPAGTLAFEQLYFSIQAAQEGLGVALAPYFLVVDDIAAGRLCIPFKRLGVTRRHYYANRAAGTPHGETGDAFCDWLRTEGAETMRLYQQLLEE
ncbi:LysR substrate-binding domain-containing protein [Pigmentiphaga soli]|uniref:LysR substrate-binding domain-containing protein n=1 Tax=Pigmentiphaga soli TaxID=1007095 RepID=A0ABP8GT15_9BURK